MDTAIKVAFASTDLKHINQHFGASQAFALYAVDPERAQLIEVVQFGQLAMDGNEDKLAAKIKALEGCVAVYAQAVGASGTSAADALIRNLVGATDYDELTATTQALDRVLTAGRYVIPVRAEAKGRVKGIVHDQSASGATLFIEPLTVVELNNTWTRAALDEQQEEERVLEQLSREVEARAESLSGSE